MIPVRKVLSQLSLNQGSSPRKPVLMEDVCAAIHCTKPTSNTLSSQKYAFWQETHGSK